jgi:Asp-tRNA(Asn)/Glu-tRNA(Gln) amidotransferase A subunit family amidase
MPEARSMKPVSALELRQQMISGEASRQEIAARSLESIERLDPGIQAFVCTRDYEEAISLAAASTGPLAGMPIGLKDIFDTSDLPTAYGSSIYGNFQPAGDAAIVSLIRRAGGYILGKTVMCEFAYMSPTMTRNPADITRTAGGSSSGSAAAVAAGMVPFAIGTQTGGSTIRPASFCGIAGYKPTFGMFPTAGMKAFSWSLDTVGLFAATVSDVAWLAESLIGRPLVPPGSTRRIVVGVPLAYPWTAPSPGAELVIEQACSAIEEAGGIVKFITFPAWIESMVNAHSVLQGYEATQTMAYEFDKYGDQLSPMLSDYLAQASSVSVSAYDCARSMIRGAKEKLAGLFDGIDVLMTPGAPDEAPLGFSTTGDPAFNKVWTLLGTPCVSIPGLTGLNGNPIGVQVIAAPWADQQCLDAAEFVERAIKLHTARK